MGILTFVTDLLIGPRRFRIPKRAFSAGNCSIRPLVASDLAACEAIYLANEAEHFPDGFFERFQAWLRSDGSLILVAEVDGIVVGLGGISLRRTPPWGELAVIEFGMVHPRLARQGIGTALLLARLAALPTETLPSTVLMNSAGSTASFYKRFGFAYFERGWVGESLLSYYVTTVTTADRAKCREVLAKSVTVAPSILQLSNESFPRRCVAETKPATEATA